MAPRLTLPVLFRRLATVAVEQLAAPSPEVRAALHSTAQWVGELGGRAPPLQVYGPLTAPQPLPVVAAAAAAVPSSRRPPQGRPGRWVDLLNEQGEPCGRTWLEEEPPPSR